MDFSLSSSLVGSAVSNPDKLALDLQFAADKTLTARKGPTPVFTRASTGRFVGSNGLIQSAGTNVARFDHDPVSLACKGLLLEESRTNVALYSGAIVNNSGWFIENATSTVSGTGPDGNSSYLIAESTGAGAHYAVNTGGATSSGATSVVIGTVYTGSIFIKKVTGSVDWIQISLGSGGFGTSQYANFNIGNGTVGDSAGLASGTSPRIENYGNGWYRCSISVAALSTTSTTANVILAFTQNTSGTTRLPSYLGSPSNSVLACLCQFETGSFATSYIPTTTASVIRSADVCSISGSDFSGFYNPLEGSFATSQIFNAPATITTGQVVFDVNDTTALNRTRFVRSGTNGFVIYANTVGGTQDVGITGSTAMIAGAVTKLAGCMKANDFTVYLNNVSQGVDTISVVQPAPTTLTIGDVSAGAARALMNGTIGSLRYFRKRLPNAKLQALTV